MNYTFVPVTDKKTRREFLELPARLYKDDPYYIRPWDHDIEKVFDPEQNKFFRHGEVERWIMRDGSGKTIGRVAAFINQREAKTFEQPTGGMGFIDCIEDQEVAFALFDKAKAWLEERGMEAMDGPINFGEKNNWWGLMVKGDSEPLYGFNYHPKYYQAFFEAYGFKPYYEQYSFARPIMEDLEGKYQEMAQRVIDNPDYEFPRFKRSELMTKGVDAFLEVYNRAWVTHEAFKPMKRTHAANLIKQLKPIADPDVLVFCYHKGEPVGFFINIPDLNQIIKHLNGKFGLWEKIKFLYYLRTHKCRKMFGMIYGVVPEYQGKGITVAMALHAKHVLTRIQRYDIFEMGWIGDFNPAMIKIADLVSCKLDKTLITYRKLFDENKPFRRRPIIGKKQEFDAEGRPIFD
jgi:GNAT superfamily N-acetyltransferase